MKATIIDKNIRNAKNMSRNKETINSLDVVATYKGKIYHPIHVKFYMGRSRPASVVYCSIWVHSRHKEIDVSGHGFAGGTGYHKESAALQKAIESSGIKLNKHIDGVGNNAMKTALEAIARAIGFTGQIAII